MNENLLLNLMAWAGNMSRQMASAWKGNPVATGIVASHQTGQPVAKLDDQASIERAIEQDPFTRLGVVRVASAVAGSPWVAEEKKMMGGKLTWQQVLAGKLVDVLEDPNDAEPPEVLWWKLVMQWYTGDAFLLKDDVVGPMKLYHVLSSRMHSIWNKDGTLSHWLFQNGDKSLRLEPDQVIHIKYPGLTSHAYGSSPVTSIKQEILQRHYYNEYLTSFFQHNAIPDILLTTDQNLTEDQKTQAEKRWMARYGSNASGKRVAVLEKGVTYAQLSPPLKDILVESVVTKPRDATLMAMGVPPVIAGLKSANYATALEEKKTFFQVTVIPAQMVFAGYLTKFLARLFNPRYRVRGDNSHVEALQPDTEKQARAYRLLFKNGVVTQNEARASVRLEGVSGGDRFMYEIDELIASQQVGGGESGEAGQGQPGQIRSGGRAVVRGDLTARGPTVEIPGRRILTDAHITGTDSSESDFRGILRSFLDGQLERVLKAVRDLQMFGNNEQLSRILLARAKQGGGNWWSPEEEAALLKAGTNPFVKATVDDAGQQAIDEVGVELTFNVENPNVAAAREEMLNRIVGINDKTYQQIINELEYAYTTGLNYNDAAQRLVDLYARINSGRALTIAKTEVGRMLNGAYHYGYEQAGVEAKQWVCAFISTSRPTHQEADGQIALMGDYFQVGGYPMRYPKDAGAPAAETVNCYCRIRAIITLESV